MAVESWTLGGAVLDGVPGLALNADPWRIEALPEFAPAPRRPQWIESADADGALLGLDPSTGLAEMTFRLRHVNGYTSDQVLTNIRELSATAAACSLDPGGSELLNAPHDSTKRVTYRALLGEIIGLPREVSGQNIGWFIRRPVVTLRLTCHPFGELEPLSNVIDNFATNTIADYVFDAGASSDVSITGGVMDAVANLTSEKRFYDAVTAYSLYDRQHTLTHALGTTVTSYKAGVLVKRIDAANYVECYVDDNGTNSRLRIDKVVAGARTNLVSTNLAARLAVSTTYRVRGRIEGNLVTAEHWTSAPTVTGTPTLSNSATLAGADATQFGQGVAGRPGICWIPQQTAANLDHSLAEPNLWRSTDPLMDRVVYGIVGDAPPKATVVSTNGSSTTHLRFAELGMGEGVITSAALIIDSDSLVTAGLGGSGNTRTGAYDPNASGNNVIRCTMTSFETAVCDTGAQIHRGRFRVKARVYATATGAQVRLAWQNEDGPLNRNDWATPTTHNGWAPVDLGIISATPSGIGSGGWTGRIEAYNDDGGTLDIDFLALIPVDYGYGRMGVDVPEGTATLVAYDQFTGTTAAGTLNTRVPPIGAAWATSGVATDFAFRDADATWNSEAVQRSTASDGGFRFGVFGSVAAGQSVEAIIGYSGPGFDSLSGVVARWVDSSNYLRLQAQWSNTLGSNLILIKTVAGVTTQMAFGKVILGVLPYYNRFKLTVYPSGRIVGSVFSQLVGQTTVLEATHADLATGGALDDGLVGIADFGNEASTRIFDDIAGFTLPAEPIVMYAGQDLRVENGTALRANVAGAQYGTTPDGYKGTFPAPPPSVVGVSRLAALVSPTDLATSTWETINHSVQHQALWTPRVRVVPE